MLLFTTTSICNFQKAQSKKGKSAEKSPQEEEAPTKFAANNAVELNQKITDQGNKVRQLKGAKAAKVCVPLIGSCKPVVKYHFFICV